MQQLGGAELGLDVPSEAFLIRQPCKCHPRCDTAPQRDAAPSPYNATPQCKLRPSALCRPLLRCRQRLAVGCRPQRKRFLLNLLGVFEHPLLTQLVGHVETRSRRRSKERQKLLQHYLDHFKVRSNWSKVRSPATTENQISPMLTFFDKAAHKSGFRKRLNYSAAAKRIFDSSFYALLLIISDLT